MDDIFGFTCLPFNEIPLSYYFCRNPDRYRRLVALAPAHISANDHSSGDDFVDSCTRCSECPGPGFKAH